MLAKVSERAMHWSRWTLLIGWGIIIVSLFYDPVSIQLTAPDNLASPLSLDLERCIQVQAQCLQESPYALGAPIFWNIIIPASIFILLVFGHDSWRRICPLAFISQTPSALGWVRRHKRTNPITGKAQYKTIKVAKDSWLGRNHLYLQFGLFYLGLCSRILFINSHRIALGSVLITTIVAALTVGFLYGGKTWCQYFCPMAPVQKIYAEPRGLLNSTAHEGERQLISQSMCRTVTPGGKEKVACVGCKSFCIDIDAERSYWQSIHKTQQQGLYYGYVGIVLGYFAYYYLYAGNWEYYFSGIWAYEEGQIAQILNPGLYLLQQSIAIPKVAAVPLVLAVFTLGGYVIGCTLEKLYNSQKKHPKVDAQTIRHRMFTVCTFFVFNVFFGFVGMSRFIHMLPTPLPRIFSIVVVVCSSLWLHRTWHRSQGQYQRERLANYLRKQVQGSTQNLNEILEEISLDSLKADEIYVLAKALPNFSAQKQKQVYEIVLRGMIEDGYIQPRKSFDDLKKLRQALKVADQDHERMLAELLRENPELITSQEQLEKATLHQFRNTSRFLKETAVDSQERIRYAVKRQNPFLKVLEHRDVKREK